MKEREYAKREDVVENIFPDASSSDENMDFNVVNGGTGFCFAIISTIPFF